MFYHLLRVTDWSIDWIEEGSGSGFYIDLEGLFTNDTVIEALSKAIETCEYWAKLITFTQPENQPPLFDTSEFTLTIPEWLESDSIDWDDTVKATTQIMWRLYDDIPA